MKKWYLSGFLIVLVVAVTLSGAGCSLLTDVGTSPPVAAPQPEAVTTTPTTTDNFTPINPAWTPPAAGSQSPALPSIADVVAKVKPSVVAINISMTSFDPFFGRSTEQGAGSGWIIQQDGIIVTNNHVVENASDITVTLDDGRTFPVDPKNVATDPLTDLAVLKIDATGLPAVTFGESRNLRLGDWVIAIGNSLDLGVSPSEGIVRSLKASVPVSQDQTLYNLIGTTAAINPGNSGGPLVNLAGEVVGITSAKISASGVEGMGYAISSNDAIPIIKKLINTGYVVRPWIGVGLYTVDQFAFYRYRLGVEQGVLVTSVASGSPADSAGIQPGDVIITFDGQKVTDVNGLLTLLHASEVGKKVTINYYRGKSAKTTIVTIAESPPPG